MWDSNYTMDNYWPTTVVNAQCWKGQGPVAIFMKL